MKRSGSSDTASGVALALAVGGPANAATDTYRVDPELSWTGFAASHPCAACEWADPDTVVSRIAVRVRMVLPAVK